MPPGQFVIVDQFIDRTFAREKSFFGEGRHRRTSPWRSRSARVSPTHHARREAEAIPFHRGGTYIVMEGPQFSTLAESRLYRSWGCDVIGMTNMPEAKLAREAEISYATIAMVTDYDSWHHEHAPVDVKEVIRVMHENRERVQQSASSRSSATFRASTRRARSAPTGRSNSPS